jgi:hypothetical protein
MREELCQEEIFIYEGVVPRRDLYSLRMQVDDENAVYGSFAF